VLFFRPRNRGIEVRQGGFPRRGGFLRCESAARARALGFDKTVYRPTAGPFRKQRTRLSAGEPAEVDVRHTSAIDHINRYGQTDGCVQSGARFFLARYGRDIAEGR